MSELITYTVECDSCNFSCFIQHNLNPEEYVIQNCPICGSEDIFTDDDEE